MFARMTQFAVMVLAGLSLGAGSVLAVDPPETTVQLDLQWLSPPQVTPDGGQAMAQQTPDYTRLQGTNVAGAGGNQGSSFTWPLRYAIETQRYPILTLRYRARDLVPGPVYGNKVMDVQLVDSGGRMTPLTVINLDELVQDGAVHEIRKDLSQVPADAFIDELRFNFQGGDTGGRLDIFGIVFDRGPNSPEPLNFTQQNVDFVVKDAAGNAMPDAEIHLGVLERANWVAIGSTDAAGHVTLTTLAPARPDGTIDPVEAVVERQGSLPQYVAPIKLPVGTPMEVKLAPVPPAPAQPQAVAPAAQDPQVIYSTTVYDQTTYVPYPVYTYTYVQPYPSYWWVPVRYVRTRPIDWCDRDDRWHQRYGDRIDVRWYDHPRPVAVPAPPVRVPPPQRLESGPVRSQPVENWPGPRPRGGPDGNRDNQQTTRPPVAVTPPPPRLDAPPDLRHREDRNRSGSAADIGRPTDPPQAMRPGPVRTSPPDQSNGNSRIVIRDSDLAGNRNAPQATPAPSRPDRAPAPARGPDAVQTPDRKDDNRQNGRVDPPARDAREARVTPVEQPARVQRGNDDAQHQPAQRDDVQRQAQQNGAQQRADAQRDAAQQEQARRDAAQRAESARQEQARRVAQTPPPAPPAPPQANRNRDDDNSNGGNAPSRAAAPAGPAGR